MDKIFINTTRSICGECKKIVDAKIYAVDNKVYMEKYCLVHGKKAVLISSDYQYYKNAHKYIKPGQLQHEVFSNTQNGCPDDCGLCGDHEQHICMPVFEITGNCNLNCPICIAEEKNRKDVSLDEIKYMVDRLLSSEKTVDVINLSGGEPTLHPEYQKIIEYLKSIDEITGISVSTNGLTFVEDSEFLSFNKENEVIVSLQLDGCDSEVYKKLRGVDLTAQKEKILSTLIEKDIDMSLIMTIARGVNDDPENVKYVYDRFINNDNILSLLFQPLVYCDNTPFKDYELNRITIPDVIELIAEINDQNIGKSDFMPLPCCNANCFSLVHLLRVKEDKYMPVKKFVEQEKYIELIKNKSFFGTDEESFHEIKDLIFSIWSGAEAACSCTENEIDLALKSIKNIIKDTQINNSNEDITNPKKRFNAASRKIKSIYIHQFMDTDTFDLTRARRCCTIYPKPDGKFYPLCNYNNIYRDRA